MEGDELGTGERWGETEGDGRSRIRGRHREQDRGVRNYRDGGK